MQTTAERTISDLITPSDEILNEEGQITTRNLLDEVDLYNLYDESDVPEKDPERILRITYPTRTLQNIIKRTTERFDPENSLHEGAHVIGGDFGSGKSHVGLVLYHLFNQTDLGQKWLDRNDIDATLPDEAQVSALQMLNLDNPSGETITHLWQPIFRELGAEEMLDDIGGVPTYADIREAVGDKPTVLFVDEIERWLGMSFRREYWDDNLGFLQNLMEASEREDTNLVTFVSLLYNDLEVDDIAGRTNPFIHNLTARQDEKIQFLTHRLVGSRDDPEGIDNLAEDYIGAYESSDLIDLEDYQKMEEKIQQYYPFHPDALNLLMQKFSGSGSNDARGLLSFLTEVLADNYEENDLILTGNVDVARDQLLDRLYAIDQELLPRYEADHDRLSSDGGFDTHVEELLNVVLLYSLSEGGHVGANRREMLMGTLRPGINSHEIIQTVTGKIEGYAWHIHRLNGEYSFDVDENPAARIEKKAEDVHTNDAVHRIENLVLEKLFGEKESVHIWSPVNTEQEIDDTKGLRILVRLDYQRNYDDEFNELIEGREFPNTLIVVGPEADIESNTGIIKMAKSVVAGEQLKQQGGELPEGFDEIHQQNHDNLLERTREKFGSVHIPTQRRGTTRLVPSKLSVRDNENFYDATIRIVAPDESDISKAVREILDDEGESGLQFKYLQKDFYTDVSLPTLTDANEFEEIVLDLCAQGEIAIDGTIDKRPSSIGGNSTVIHADYVSVDVGGGGEGGDDGGFGGVDVGGSEGGSSGGGSLGGSAGGSAGGTTGGSGGGSTPTIETFPSMPPLSADNKFSLVDDLERQLNSSWKIHEMKITVDASLSDGDLDKHGLNGYSELNGTSLRERFKFDPESPLSKRRVLDIVEDLDVPASASIDVRMEVQKNE
jgi:hypothetical protein